MPFLEVSNLQVNIKNKAILKGINFTASLGEFIAIMGPSGCGKTTLIKELAGFNNRVEGSINIDNLSIYESFHDNLKSRIAYVEQFNQLHLDLTVSQVLTFTAGLRETADKSIRIKNAINDLNLKEHAETPVKSLSGGTAKRVAIAAELLSDPDILLLDEPTSPLDPETIEEFLSIVKNLAQKSNKLVIMVTHKPNDLRYVDRVLFLAAGGHQVYLGPQINFISTIQAILKQKGITIAEKENEILFLYRQFKEESLGKTVADTQHYTVKRSDFRNKRAIKSRRFNFLIQLYWLTARYLAVKFPKMVSFPDGWIKSVLSYLAQPVIVGLLFLSFPFFNNTCLFLISLAVIWFSVNNSSKEIAEENHVYKRERSFNLKIDAYLLSKIIVLWSISMIQILILLFIVWTRFYHGREGEINILRPVDMGIFLGALSLSAITLGLMLSTISEKVDKVLIWVPIVMMAQIVFSGLVSKPDKKFKENLSYLMIGRWGLEGLTRLQDSSGVKSREVLRFKLPVTERDTIVDTLVTKSIVVDKPLILPSDTLATDTVGALQNLGAYNDKLKRDKLPSWTIFNSYKWNVIVILLHGLLYYMICRLVLLKKDYIPYYFFLPPRAITFILHIILYCLISFVILSPYISTPIKYRDTSKDKEHLELKNWYEDLQHQMQNN